MKFPDSWTVRVLMRCRLALLLFRSTRSSGVVAISHYHYWVYGDGPYIEGATFVTVDGKKRVFNAHFQGPKLFRSKTREGTQVIGVRDAKRRKSNFTVPHLEAPAKYLLYVEPERKDGTPAIVDLVRVRRTGVLKNVIEPAGGSPTAS